MLSKALVILLLSLPAWSLRAASPFAANLKGLQYVILAVNGDEKPAKKAGYSLSSIKSDLEIQLKKAGLKVVSKGSQVPEGKSAMPAELLLGMVNQGNMYSYALTFQSYEPMRLNGSDRLYISWSSLLYGFGMQDTIKSQIKSQAKDLVDAFAADYRKANRR